MPSTFNQTGSGGTIVQGAAKINARYTPALTPAGVMTQGIGVADLITDTHVYCRCNTYEQTTSGGMKLGSSATVTDNIVRGGFKVGSSATITQTGEAYEDFACIYPLNEDGDGTPGEFKDETLNHLDGTGGLLFDGSNDVTSTPVQTNGVGCQFAEAFDGRAYIGTDHDCLIPTQPFSISCWAKITTFGKARTFYSRGYDSGTPTKWIAALGHTFLNQITFSVQTFNGTTYTSNIVQGPTILERNINYHFAAVFIPGDSIKVYINGVLENTRPITDTQTTDINSGNYIGRWNDKANPIGNIQEVRLSGVVRSSDWFLAEYHDLCGTFYEVGEEINFTYH